MDRGIKMKLNLHDAEFLLSAVNESHYPKHSYPEIALVGRSNVGKSSLLNALVNRKKFARVSGQPGRTQTLNFYRIDQLVIVDLPGYGYARVSEAIRRQWRPMIENYLTKRPNLKGIIQVIDIRHQPTADDRMMAEWINAMGIPAFVVATKADKISRGRHKPSLEKITDILQIPGIVFSSETRLGRDALISIVQQLALQSEG